MAATVTVACNVVGGLILGPAVNSAGQSVTVTLNGSQTAVNGLNLGFGSTGPGQTEVDQTFWNNWLAGYANGPLVTGTQPAVWVI